MLLQSGEDRANVHRVSAARLRRGGHPASCRGAAALAAIASAGVGGLPFRSRRFLGHSAFVSLVMAFMPRLGSPPSAPATFVYSKDERIWMAFRANGCGRCDTMESDRPEHNEVPATAVRDVGEAPVASVASEAPQAPLRPGWKLSLIHI